MKPKRPQASLIKPLQVPALRKMMAGAELCVDGFQKATERQGSVIRELTHGAEIVQHEHYPDSDVVDAGSGAHYFYHAHRSEAHEHGHLHLFWHADSIGRRVKRRSTSSRSVWAPSHLLAIGLDPGGLPVSLFTTNLWVTDGHWFNASQTHDLIRRFRLSHRGRYGAVNRFVNGLLDMYEPHIHDLLLARDRKVAQLTRKRSWHEVSQDNRHEVLSYQPLNWLADIEEIEATLAKT